MPSLPALEDFARDHSLALRAILTEPPGTRWEVRLTTKHLHQPLCAGFGDTIDAAAAECLAKAPRAYASHERTIQCSKSAPSPMT